MCKYLLFHFLSNPKFKGILEVTYKGKTLTFGHAVTDDASVHIAKADMRIVNDAFFRRAALFGATGFGKAYFLGDFETSDLKNLLLWFLQNRDLLPGFGTNSDSSRLINVASTALRWMHYFRRNTRTGSKKNIKDHYDISNDFYALWLDSSMTYSSALFRTDDEDLRSAQENKYRSICEKSGIRPGDKVLEIGCGWGGFAVFAAKHYGCELTITTISDEQFAYTEERIRREGLEDKITLIKKDYRDLTGTFSKIVSIEMMEALGHEFVPVFMKKCQELLEKDGTLCVQCITTSDAEFKEYVQRTDFIKEYIFPGSELLSLKQVSGTAAELGMTTVSVERMGRSYAKTLNLWRKNFLAKKAEVLAHGLDEQFCRKWLYYLISCEVGFLTGEIDVAQVLMAKRD